MVKRTPASSVPVKLRTRDPDDCVHLPLVPTTPEDADPSASMATMSRKSAKVAEAKRPVKVKSGLQPGNDVSSSGTLDLTASEMILSEHYTYIVEFQLGVCIHIYVQTYMCIHICFVYRVSEKERDSTGFDVLCVMFLTRSIGRRIKRGCESSRCHPTFACDLPEIKGSVTVSTDSVSCVSARGVAEYRFITSLAYWGTKWNTVNMPSTTNIHKD
jgi:hypothetical protein